MAQDDFKENVDFYWDKEGLMVLTREYLLKQGHCCEGGCLHCPYDFKKDKRSKAGTN